MRLKTNYEIGTIPHQEYPRPQAQRNAWLCLNGEWDFYKTDGKNKEYEGKILVPFSPETLNSGIPDGFVLNPKEELRYSRKFTLNESLLRGITLLHFDAVDSECEVYCNGTRVGAHCGGFTAFSVDISEVAKLGENEVLLICRDEGTRNSGARGKQSDERGGIWYTPQSGIWQSAWIESMPNERIGEFLIIPNALDKKVEILLDNDIQTEITVFDSGRIVQKGTHDELLREENGKYRELWDAQAQYYIAQ